MPQQTITQVAPSTAGLAKIPSMACAGGAEVRVSAAEPRATPDARRANPTRAFSGRVEASTGARIAHRRVAAARRARAPGSFARVGAAETKADIALGADDASDGV